MAGIDSNTLLMLHGDDLTDSSSNAVAITNSGVTASITQSKFGGKSLYFNGSSYLTLQNLNLIPKSGDFTIDWWEYRTASTTGGSVFHQTGVDKDGLGFLVGFNSNNYFYCQSTATTTAWDIANQKQYGAATLNAWVHYAIVRNGSNWLFFRNGSLHTSFSSTATIRTLNSYPVMGQYSHSSLTYFTGYIDEFRISNIARWTENFEVPTEAYSEPITVPTLSHTFTRLLNNVLYYGKVFVVNPKGRVNLRCDLASAFATPVGGIKLETLPVGSEVKIPVSGVDCNFIVVNQGNPDSALYDSSCDGTWLLMKDVYSTTIWDSSNNKLAESDIHAYLNSDFLGLLDTEVQDAIKQVKIPYYEGGGYGLTTHTGADGLSAKVFLLSPYELGASAQDHLPVDGSKLDYFDGSNDMRLAYHNGSIAKYWTRSAHGYYGEKIWFVDNMGRTVQYDSCNISGYYYVRPSLILPSDTGADDNGDGTYSPVFPDKPKEGTPLGEVPEGETVWIEENGTLVEYYVAKHDYEPDLNGEGRTLLVRKDGYQKQAWHSVAGASGYPTSDIDTWFNSTFKALLPSDIQEAMATTKFYYTVDQSSTTSTILPVGTLERSVFALSLAEMGFSHTYANAEGSTLPIASTLKVVRLDGSVVGQWTRSTYNRWTDDGTSPFSVTSSGGRVTPNNSNLVIFVSRPCFTLPEDRVSVDEDGYLTIKPAP